MRPKVSKHRGAGEDAANQPKDAPMRLQALILFIFIDQNRLQAQPLRHKASNHRRAGGSPSGHRHPTTGGERDHDHYPPRGGLPNLRHICMRLQVYHPPPGRRV